MSRSRSCLFIGFLGAAAALGAAACANPNDRPPNAPDQPPYSTAHLTSGQVAGKVPVTGDEDTVGGEGYGGTTEYGLTYDPQGGVSKANVDRHGRYSNVEKDQGGGDIRTDSIAR